LCLSCRKITLIAYVPAEHGLWTTAVFEHSEPAGQSVHDEAPALSAYVPDAHVVQRFVSDAIQLKLDFF
jgi:hypothetical protein